MSLLNILGKLAHCYCTEKWQISMVLIEVIFCYNSAKYTVNFVDFRSVIVRNDMSIKSVKAFSTTFQVYCQLTLLS